MSTVFLPKRAWVSGQRLISTKAQETLPNLPKARGPVESVRDPLISSVRSNRSTPAASSLVARLTSSRPCFTEPKRDRVNRFGVEPSCAEGEIKHE